MNAQIALKTQSSKVLLKPKHAGPAIGRHPWVFADAIQSIDGTPADGDVVQVVKAEDESFIAEGIFNSKSQIRVRLYSWNPKASIVEESFWAERIERAISLRLNVLGFGPSESFRVVFSEADEISGLTVDKFGEFLSVQISSVAIFERRDLILDVLKKAFSPRGIKVKTDRAVLEKEGLEKVEMWVGETPTDKIEIQAGTVKYFADLRAGQKTGFYLDQRENRRVVSALAKGRRVLDLFCYAGGFALESAKAGALSVVGVDSSEAAIELARSNAELNSIQKAEFVEADVFDYLLTQKPCSQDMVVVDPPRFATNRTDVERALRKYFKLNEEALRVLAPGGIFVSCSCSGLVTPDEFLSMLASVARRAKRSMQFLEVRGANRDHPVISSCPETNYLKVVIARVN